MSFGRDVVDDGGEEVSGGEDLEIGLGVVGAVGAVDDCFGVRVPGGFLEREGSAQQVLGEALTALEVGGADEIGVGVDMEAAVFPG